MVLRKLFLTIQFRFLQFRSCSTLSFARSLTPSAHLTCGWIAIDVRGRCVLPTDAGGSGGHVQHQDTQVLLSSVPPPEFWCSITYFALDTQVRTDRERC